MKEENINVNLFGDLRNAHQPELCDSRFISTNRQKRVDNALERHTQATLLLGTCGNRSISTYYIF